MMDRAIVLMSGGIDSTVCAAYAAESLGNDNVIGLSIAYGQKHNIEIDRAMSIAKKLQLFDHVVVSLDPDMFNRSGCSLVDSDVEVPETTYEEVNRQMGPSPMYVPFRNGLFLSIAAADAIQRNAQYVFYGAHSEDARNYAYPDCTPEFNGAMMNAISFGTYNAVRLVTPLQWMSKAEIVREGVRLEIPFELTYSCYCGRTMHCGKCATCVGRIEAFKANQMVDPVEYEIDVEWGPYKDYINWNKFH